MSVGRLSSPANKDWLYAKDANALAEQVTGYLESVETKLRTAEVERARFRITLGLGAAALAILIAGIVATAWQAREAVKPSLSICNITLLTIPKRLVC
ncbi:MAG: hypothetical protein AB8B55_04230 [Mariniblastus sp.]